MVAGPLLVRLILVRDPTFRTLFLTGAAICAFFILFMLVLYRETRPAAARAEGAMRATLRGCRIVLRDHVPVMAAASLLVGLGLAGTVLLAWGAWTFAAIFVLKQGGGFRGRTRATLRGSPPPPPGKTSRSVRQGG